VLVRETGDLLRLILGRVGQINEVITEIATSAELQAKTSIRLTMPWANWTA
jgi:methyl-accepting chemotaxis protein